MTARFERHGGPPDLSNAFKEFVIRKLGGRCFDDDKDKKSGNGKIPDYAAFGDRLLIEVKQFESEQDDRIQKVLDDKIIDEEKPVFYGKRT
jgi:hypothetical protein